MKSFLSSVGLSIRRRTSRTWKYAKSHKIIAVVVVAAVIGGGYWAYAAQTAKTTTTQYTLTKATQESIQSTVTASGQVAASHQLDLSPKASGEVTSIAVTAGQKVAAGQLIATVDDTDAEKSVRDAKLSLESAQISYDQSVTSANNTTANGAVSVATASVSGFDAAATVQTDLATIAQGLSDLQTNSTDLGSNYVGQPALRAYIIDIQDNAPTAATVAQQAKDSLATAQSSYNATFTLYQAANRSSSPASIQALLESEADTASKLSQAVKDNQAFLQLVKTTTIDHDLLTQPPSIDTQLSTVNGYTTTITSDASKLASAQSSLTSAVQAQSSNTATATGGTSLTIRSAQLTLAKAQETLSDAQEALSDYVVRAPFAGTVANVAVQKYDQASSGTAVATLITDEQIADLSLNETDIASVKVGQKVTLTFDAIDGLTIDGTVAIVDQTGTVSQNVTTYAVKIGFDTQDARVKPGMTADATIITASKESALVIPQSALKTEGDAYYVEVVSNAPSTAPTDAPPGGGFGSSTRAGPVGGFGSSTRAAGGFGSSSFAGGARGTSSSTNPSANFSRTQTVAADSVTVTRVPVTIGIESDTMVEITSGLTQGQSVVSQSLNASGTSTATQSRGLFGLFGGGSSRTTTGTRTTGTSARTSGTSGTGGGFGGGAPSGPPPGGF